MKRCSLLIRLALLLCVAMTIVFQPASSLAYMAVKSNTMQNFFRVVYQPAQPISVPVAIHKSVVSLGAGRLGPGGFEFSLLNLDTGKTEVATSSADGSAVIDLPFMANDAGKTYHYRLSEINTGRKHVIYDETTYDISVTLALNDVHELSAQLTVDGEPVTQIAAVFENQYFVPLSLPDTGDSSGGPLWTALLILSAAGLAVLGKTRSVHRRKQ